VTRGQRRRSSTARKVVAAILDLFTFFIAAASIAVTFAGGLAPDGERLNGWVALVVFLSTGVYVVFGKALLGGTFWQRILNV
jgi:hypothetical protein